MKTTVCYPEGHVLLRNLKRQYPVISHGKGIRLFDANGKDYIDASGGAMTCSVGHAHPKVIEAINQQMKKVSYVNGQHFSSVPMEEFAEKLSQHMCGDLSRVCLLGSGSEAIEAGVKFIRQLWVERGQTQKSKFITRSPGYHGNTLFALSASARPHYKKFYGPLLHEVLTLSAPYGYRSPVQPYDEKATEHYIAELENLIEKEGAETIAAIMLEPVIGSSAGASLPPPGYMTALQKLCHENNILIMADEVLCGAGRCGSFLASSLLGLEPDVLVLGKGINGGYVPASALVVRESHLAEIKAGSGNFMHAQTYLQSPLPAASALAVLTVIEEEGLLSNCEKVGQYMQAKLQELVTDFDFVGNVSGIGLLAGIEFVKNKHTKEAFARDQYFAEKWMNTALENGLVTWTNTGHADGVKGDLFMLAPPLNISRSEVDEMIERIRKSLESIAGVGTK